MARVLKMAGYYGVDVLAQNIKNPQYKYRCLKLFFFHCKYKICFCLENLIDGISIASVLKYERNIVKNLSTSVTVYFYRYPQNHPLIIPPVSDAFSEPIPTIDSLYSPEFALEDVRDFVMEALHEAVDVNQVHNRDPIGWSNENLLL